jgi:REP element-mobilizing transposase RayT
MEYTHEGPTVHLVVYHVIWCSKRRRKVLIGSLRTRLRQIIHEVAAEHEWTVLELAIPPDHVHLFVRVDPQTLPFRYPKTYQRMRLASSAARVPAASQAPLAVDEELFPEHSRQCEPGDHQEECREAEQDVDG